MRLSNALIEKRRPAFFAAGLLFALSLTLVSFEWRTPYVDLVISDSQLEYEYPQGLVVTLEEPEEKPTRPEPPKLEEVKTNEIKVVNDAVPAADPSETFEPYQDPDVSSLGGEEEDVDDPSLVPLDRSEILPKFCAGEEAMLKFLGENLKYPRIPLENGVSGTVYVKFVVDKSGKLRDAKVLRPVDQWLDAEALRVAKMLECFTPGMQGGHKVDVYFVLPVRFAIN